MYAVAACYRLLMIRMARREGECLRRLPSVIPAPPIVMNARHVRADPEQVKTVGERGECGRFILRAPRHASEGIPCGRLSGWRLCAAGEYERRQEQYRMEHGFNADRIGQCRRLRFAERR